MAAEATRQPAARKAVPKIKRRPAGSLLDARSREYRHGLKVRAQLVASVGGRPTVTQAMLIDQAVSLSIHLKQVDDRLTAGAPMPAQQSKNFIGVG